MNFDEISELSLHFIDRQIVDENTTINKEQDKEYLTDVINHYIDNKYLTENNYIEPVSGITTLSNYAYISNNLIENIFINDVIFIGIGTFEQCSNLHSISNTCGYITLSNSSFANCYSLEKLPICDNVPDRCFYKCISLQYITISYKVKSIGVEAFSECHSLNNIELPNNVTIINTMAFSHCINLKQIKLSENLEIIEAYAFDKSGLVQIRIPSKVKFIETNAFANIPSLTQVIFDTEQDSEIIFNENVFSNSDNVKIINRNKNKCISNFCKEYNITEII